MVQIKSANRLGSVFVVSGHWVFSQDSDREQLPDHQRGAAGTFEMSFIAQTPQDAIEQTVKAISNDIRILRVELAE